MEFRINKLILILLLSLSTLIASNKDSTGFKYAIYPELIGLGGLPSISIEKPMDNNSILRFGLGMIVGQAITTPISIYKIDNSKRVKREKGFGLLIAPFSEIAIVGIYNLRFEPTKNSFIRLGWIGGISLNIYPVMLPTIGFGIKIGDKS
jgi:hypothetical protein